MSMPASAPEAPDLAQASVRWLSALLDSASTDVIGVSSWWDRARTALETAAASGDSYSRAVSVACRKLQIDSLSEGSSRTLADLEAVIGPHLAAWADLAARDAVYLTALVRVQRTAARASREATR